VGGRGVAGDADPGRGDSPGGGKNGGLNPGGLLSALVISSKHTGIQVEVRQVVTLAGACPYQEEGICVVSSQFGHPTLSRTQGKEEAFP